MIFSLENRTKIIITLFLWLLYGVLHLLSMRWLVSVQPQGLIVDAGVHAALIIVFAMLFWRIMKYANLDSLPIIQRIVNYVVIGMFGVSVVIGLGYLFTFLVIGGDDSSFFIPTIPVRGLIGIMLYVIFILLFQLKIKSQVEAAFETGNVIVEMDTKEEETVPEESDKIDMLERIAVKAGTKIHVILVQDILYLQADGDYIHIVTEQGKYLKEQTMKYFEAHLSPKLFVRIHRSSIVHVEKISRIELYEKQSQRVLLKNGQHLPVSVGGYKLLRAALSL